MDRIGEEENVTAISANDPAIVGNNIRAKKRRTRKLVKDKVCYSYITVRVGYLCYYMSLG